MPDLIGSWIGVAGSGRWRPDHLPSYIRDPSWPVLHAAIAAGTAFHEATVLITGATRSGTIGWSIARNLLAGGARVLIAGRGPRDRLAQAVETLVASAGQGAAAEALVDQGDLSSIDALLDETRRQGLVFTHLFPFAAINHPRLLVSVRPEDFATVFAVNTWGVYRLAVRMARQADRRHPWSVILPLSANLGQLRGSGLYPASKAALRPLVVQGQHEFGDRHGGAFIGVDLPWTRSPLMAKLEGRVDAAHQHGVATLSPDATAALCTALATPQARVLAGRILDAAAGFDQLDPAGFDAVLGG